ncbi:MAG: DUF1932 domain-containing protein [Burkholderiaceae bacterium]
MSVESSTIRHIVFLGFGEAGTALARGLCAPDGWRGAQSGRTVSAIDPLAGSGALGEAMAATASALEIPIERQYGVLLAQADLVVSVVTGVEAVNAARMAAPVLKPSAVYADFNSITGPQTQRVASELTNSGIIFADVAVMGSFMANGYQTPLLLSGPGAARMQTFSQAAGIPARILNDRVGDASAVKILRSVLMKGIEALSVECLVAAHRQGLVNEVLDNVGDVDKSGFAHFLKVMVISHLPHAKRRMEEVEKAIENLNETGVRPIMSESTRRSHARTVAAKLDPSIVMGIDLNQALSLLDERVVGQVSSELGVASADSEQSES